MDAPYLLVSIFLVRRCLFNIKSTESSKREIHQCYKKDQEMSRLNHNDPLNKWTLVLTETLPDSRGQVESIFIGPIIIGSTIKLSQRCSDLIDVSLAIYNRSISEFGQFAVKSKPIIRFSKLVWPVSPARALNSTIHCNALYLWQFVSPRPMVMISLIFSNVM